MMWTYYPHAHRFMMGSGFGFPFFPFLLFLGIIFLIWAIAARNGSDNIEEEDTTEESAVEILKKRYAKGEITKRQYREMKKDIL